MPATLRHIRIFISSPGDVRPERDALEAVISDDLQRTLGRQHNLYLEPLRWENLARPGLGDIQTQVSGQMGAYDIFVGIFWKRFGTPTAKHESGSEEEFRDAFALWEEDNDRPVMMYFCEREANISLDTDAEKAMEQIQQAQKVKAFREEIGQKGLYWTYKEVDEFKIEIRRHLHDAILSLLEKPDFEEKAPEVDSEDKKNAKTVNYYTSHIHVENSTGSITGFNIGTGSDEKGTDSEVKEALESYLKNLKAYCLRLPLRDLQRTSVNARQVDLGQVYIALDTETQVKPDGTIVRNEDGIPHKLQRKIDHIEEEETRPLSVFEATENHEVLAIIGDPGSGKSSFVKHYLASACDRWLDDPETDDPLPVLITLRSLADRLREAALPSGSDELKVFLIEKVLEEIRRDLSRLYDSEDKSSQLEKALKAGRGLWAFDGLDEVPLKERLLIKQAILAVIERFGAEKAIITCRTRSYYGDAVLDACPRYKIADLTGEQQVQFARAWYRSSQQDSERAEENGDKLVQALERPTIADIGKTPMLLTILSIVHEQDHTLPDHRVILYDRAIEILLVKWEARLGDHRHLSDPVVRAFIADKSRVGPLLQELAFQALNTGINSVQQGVIIKHIDGAAVAMKGVPNVAYIEMAQALPILERELGSLDAAKAFLTYLDTRAGLLQGEGEADGWQNRFSFAHRTFQEYLAACHLLTHDLDEKTELLKDFAGQGEYWTLVVKLAMEESYYNSKGRETRELLNMLSLAFRADTSTEAGARLGVWAGYGANLVGGEEVGAKSKIKPDGGAEFLDRVRIGLTECLQSELGEAERVEAGRLLAHLGDPREELLEVEKMVFCYVPKGPFLMGSTDLDNLADDDEKPQHKLTIPYDYWIGRYPVTVSQYQAFVEAGGYENDTWWTDTGLAWMKDKEITGIRGFGEPYSLPNHPVVGVSWYEAVAYCNWLEAYLKEKKLIPTNMRILLPSEAEWEKAARGGIEIPPTPIIGKPGDFTIGAVDMENNETSDRIYPWGNEIEEDHLNYQSQIGSTSTPGCFVSNYSPYGTEGMAGNVFDWTRSKWEKKGYPYPIEGEAKANREDLKGDDLRVLRGGSFNYDDNNVRCASRSLDFPDARSYNVGFRVIALPLP